MESLVPIIINLLSGAVGGNIVGAIVKKLSLGFLGNSLSGIVGGGLGGWILSRMMGSSAVTDATNVATSMDMGHIVSQIAGGGVGGGVLMLIVGVIKSMTASKA